MGDEEAYEMMTKGKLYVSVAGGPLKEFGALVKCNSLNCGKIPERFHKPFKRSYDIQFKVEETSEMKKVMDMLAESSTKAVAGLYEKIEKFCRIFVEDYLGMDSESFTKEYAAEHEIAAVWNDKQDCFYGLRMDGKLYSVGGLLFKWCDDGDLILADIDKPYWANKEVREKLKSFGYEE